LGVSSDAYSLCAHHGTEKKVLFAELTHQFREEIHEAADTCLTEFDGSFNLRIEKSISSIVAEGIASDWEEVLGVVRMAKQLFTEEEVTIEDGELSIKTNFEGIFSASILHGID
jgi:hypothetical protein